MQFLETTDIREIRKLIVYAAEPLVPKQVAGLYEEVKAATKQDKTLFYPYHAPRRSYAPQIVAYINQGTDEVRVNLEFPVTYRVGTQQPIEDKTWENVDKWLSEKSGLLGRSKRSRLYGISFSSEDFTLAIGSACNALGKMDDKGTPIIAVDQANHFEPDWRQQALLVNEQSKIPPSSNSIERLFIQPSFAKILEKMEGVHIT